MFNLYNDCYIAIIGDIIDSRELKERMQVQKQLNQTLNEINTIYKDSISSDFIITLGDEFQGLLRQGTYTMQIIMKIEKSMNPVKIRFGVGIGEITTDINRNMSIGADGPAYYNARDAINELKSRETQKSVSYSDIRFCGGRENEDVVLLINNTLTLMYVIKSGWSERQKEVIDELLDGNRSQREIALKLDITESTVSTNLNRGNYHAFRESLEGLNYVLGEIKADV